MQLDRPLLNERRINFIGASAPLGYVAGLGRGATGFTTRSDIGPAREVGDAPDKIPFQNNKRKANDDDDDNDNLNDANYDDFEGYGGNICAKDPYDKDDEEADKIYQDIDDRLDERRKERREKRLKLELEKYRVERPKIQQMFADVKKDLADVSTEEWNNLPEVGDARNKRARNPRAEKYTPAPDLILSRNLNMLATSTTIDAREQLYGGIASTIPGTSTQGIDLTTRDARNKLMNTKLSQICDSITGQTVVDPTGYLTGLQSMIPNSGTDVSDIKKARMVLQSIRLTNPKLASTWISSAYLEEVAGKLQAARSLIMSGCEHCPHSEDLWFEASRLLQAEQAQLALKAGLKNLPQSVRLWMRSAALETKTSNKKVIYRKALENVPNSVELWKAAIDLEDEESAKIMLGRAVECCPHNIEFWLALSKLETYERAKDVLNMARSKIPTERLIWITAAELEESQGNLQKVEMIVERALKSLEAKGVEINRDQWFKEAEDAEKAKYIHTCKTIVRNVAGIGVEKEDKMKTWIHDAKGFIANGSIECAREMYTQAIKTFQREEEIWLDMALFESNYGTDESLDKLLQLAVTYCPKTEDLWLMGAKSKWLSGNVPAARSILSLAFKANPNSESVWLAAVKLESENNEYERSRTLLQRARKTCPSERVFMKSVKFEWCMGDIESAKSLLNDSLERYPTFPKLWMMKGQLEDQSGNLEAAKEAYQQGLKKCPHSIPLWLLLSRMEERIGMLIKARAVLEKARLKNPKNPQLWLEAVRLEIRGNLKNAAQSLMARALQECPKSGILWAETISIESRQLKKSNSEAALKNCGDDAHVLLAVAKYLWSERKLDKARKWFKRANEIDPELGDAWAFYYKFETIYGTEAQREEVMKRCVNAEPHQGEYWCNVSKDVKNWRLKIEAILPLVAQMVPVPL